MPSFDVVSEIDMQEVRNAVDQANREIKTRFDFRNVPASFVLEESRIVVSALEEFQVAQMEDMLRDKLTRRNVSVLCLKAGEIEGSGKEKRKSFVLLQGIDKDNARELVKTVKESGAKVQTSIQGEKVRVNGKKRDDLQQVIALLRKAELGIALQFNNFRD